MESETLVLKMPLTEEEQRDLARREEYIEENLQTLFSVGKAFADIRDRKLYRESHRTFEEYCRERWQISRPRAYQLIDASIVQETVSTNVDKNMPLPTNESQTRALKKAPKEKQPELGEKAVKSNNGNAPTARQIIQVIETEFEEKKPAKVTRACVDCGKEFEKPADRQDLVRCPDCRMNDYEQITITTPTEKISIIAPRLEPEDHRNCCHCKYWKNRNSSTPGVMIPDGKGKCVREGGHCDPHIVKSGIGQRNYVRNPELWQTLPKMEIRQYDWKCARCGRYAEAGMMREYKGELICWACLTVAEKDELGWAEIHRKAEEARKIKEDFDRKHHPEPEPEFDDKEACALCGEEFAVDKLYFERTNLVGICRLCARKALIHFLCPGCDFDLLEPVSQDEYLTEQAEKAERHNI
jgi:hypothetical protein